MRAWSPFILWALVIFIGSSVPGNEVPGPVSQVSIVLHVSEYAVLACLAYRAFASWWPFNTFRAAWYTAFICVVYSVTDEMHQLFVPGRHADAHDLIADAAGILIGVAGWYWYQRLFTGKPSHR